MIRAAGLFLALAILGGPAGAAAAPLPDPGEFPVDSPQKTLTQFLTAWRVRDWAAMARRCQLTWLARQKAPGEFLRSHFAGKRLRKAEIKGTRQGCGGIFPSFTCATVSAAVRFAEPDGRTKVVLIHARLFKETAPGKLDEQGSWGVNPLSLAGLVAERRP